MDEDDPKSDVEDDTGQQSEDEGLGMENLTLGSAAAKTKKSVEKQPPKPEAAPKPAPKKLKTEKVKQKKRERVVEEGLLQYVNTATCRRKVCDEYFNNPPRDFRKIPESRPSHTVSNVSFFSPSCWPLLRYLRQGTPHGPRTR